MQTEHEQDQATTLTVDPVITWLEQCRDFIGTTPQAREMAQRTIDRLRPPAIDVLAVIDTLLIDTGTWRFGRGSVISDRPQHPQADAEDAGYYGGYMVAESISRRNAIAVSFLPGLLAAARDSQTGRAVLTSLAYTLAAPSEPERPITDRLDGCLRLAQIGHEFSFGHYGDEFAGVAECLKHLSGGLLTGRVADARADIEAWLDRKREARLAGSGLSPAIDPTDDPSGS